MKNEAVDEKLETPREIAAVIRTTPQSVLNWHRTGLIPSRICVGRIIRFNRGDVLAALDANRREVKP